MTENIILIGFMGCGKTSVGRELAKSLKLEFVDMDYEIEKEQQMTISEIFNTKGQDFFRNLETEYLKKLINKKGIILSTGGGIIIKEENVELLNKIGTIVWLNSSVKNTVRNLQNEVNKRPLLKDKHDLENEIKDLLEKRYDLYKNASNIEIIVDDKNIKDVVSQILVKLS